MMRLICLSAVVALAFISCKKTDTKTIVLRGSTQQLAGEGKVYLDPNYQVLFESGDLVKFFNLSNTPSNSEMATFEATETGQSVQFQLSGASMSVENKGAFCGFYPAGKIISNTLTTDNKAVFRLNDVQQYHEIGGMPTLSAEDLCMFAKVDDVANIGDANFSFQNINGVLGLRYYDTYGWTIRNIKVIDKTYFSGEDEGEGEGKDYGEDDEYIYIATGDVQVDVSNFSVEALTNLCNAYDPTNPSTTLIEDFKESIGYSITNGHSVVTLDFGTGGYTLSSDANNPSVFYIVLPPLALAHGYRVIVTDMDGSEYTVVDSDTNKKMIPNIIKMNPAKDLANFH